VNVRERLAWVSAAMTLTVCLTASGAWAMPNLARKYGAECGVCHTTIPRLNEYGFNFRKAGFRTPEEIGQATKTEFGDTFAARVQARFDSNHRDDAGKKTDTNQLTLHEVTLYPLSASFGKYYSSLMELSILGEDFVEIENAYFRYTRGKPTGWFAGRAGIFHPFEGYGASDRPYSIDRPLFQTTVANHNGSTFFTPWNFDQAGVEAAYVHKRTSLSATVFNGLFVENDEGTLKAFPAAGGNLQKRAGFSKRNAKDFQLFANQILQPDGTGVSAYYYHGQIDLPLPGVAPDSFGAANSFGDGFDRLAIYGNYRPMPRVELQGAYQYGKDHFFDTVAGSASGTFKSQGLFGELDLPVSERVTFGGRYDWFDPSDKKTHNNRTAFTLYANVPFNDGWQVITQYRHIAQQRTGPDLKDNNVQVRMIWIW
jgi:hypothetical protein